MAIKLAKRKKSQRGSKYVDESYTGPEPIWTDADTWSGEKYYRERNRTTTFYSYYYKNKDFVVWIVDFMKANGYTKEQIKFYKAAEDWRTKSTIASYARALMNGMPENNEGVPAYLDTLAGVCATYVRDATDIVKEDINKIVEIGSKILEEREEQEENSVKKYRPSIQQLLRDKALSMTDDIEEFIDSFDNTTKMLKEFDPYKLLIREQAKANHAKIILNQYKPVVDELDELLNPPKRMNERQKDFYEQLKEGYSYLTKPEIKVMYKMYLSIVEACDMIIAKAKATRTPRKKKPVSAEKQVAKFKYMKQHVDTKTVSMNPVDIVGAQAVLVYNAKNRKLGIYYASNIDPKGLGREGSGLSVKGTTIQGFDEKNSVQKTLRKPAEQLSTFKKITKRSLQKEFGAINSVETKMNGRFNDNSLIIKVF
jgi:hypothetical protein